MIKNHRTVRAFSIALMLLSLTLGAKLAMAQGGTGKEKPAPPPSTKAKPPVTRPAPVINLEGTTWGLEGREEGKALGKGVFEFLPGGELRTNGDLDRDAGWKQTGRRVVITFTDGPAKSTMDGLITGNQINGSITAIGRDGVRHNARWSAKRADAELLAELGFWKSIKDSTNPEDFNTYLRKYPDGAFVEPAMGKVKALESSNAKPTASPATEPSGNTAANTSSPTAPKPGTIVRGQAGIEIVWIPAGSFMMGSNEYPTEQPVHRVTLAVNEEASARARMAIAKAEEDFQSFRRELNRAKALLQEKVLSQAEFDAAQIRYNEAKTRLDSLQTKTGEYGFYMGKFEVTQAQWQAVMGTNPSSFKDCGNCPVDGVSWQDAQEFLDKLNDANDGFRYRLPTEAEWEYACRAGTATTFAFGDSLSSDQANFDGRSRYRGASAGPYRAKTTPVGSFQPNAWGLYDMHGNVWEWCADVGHDNYDGAPSDGSAWLSGGNSGRRVLRGGGWSTPHTAVDQRSANRISLTPQTHYSDDGFRIVAVPRAR